VKLRTECRYTILNKCGTQNVLFKLRLKSLILQRSCCDKFSAVTMTAYLLISEGFVFHCLNKRAFGTHVYCRDCKQISHAVIKYLLPWTKRRCKVLLTSLLVFKCVYGCIEVYIQLRPFLCSVKNLTVCSSVVIHVPPSLAVRADGI